jgi:hypothetical protein
MISSVDMVLYLLHLGERVLGLSETKFIKIGFVIPNG